MEKTTELTSSPQKLRKPASIWARFSTAKFNSEYFRMFQQVPLMLNMRLGGKHGPIPKDAHNILIVNNGLIGEFITSLPAIRHLLDSTGAQVDIMVSPTLESLVKKMVGINNIFTRPSVYHRGTEYTSHKQENLRSYDCVVVLQLSREAYRTLKEIDYQRIKLALGTYLKYGFYIIRHMRTSANLRQLEDVLFDVLEVQKRKNVQFDEVFRFLKKDYENLDRFPFLRDATVKNIIIHTGSGWAAKQWSIENWVELLTELHLLDHFQFIFVGGTEREEAVSQAIARQLPFRVHSLVRQVNLGELALIMKHCHSFIGVDSGPRHIAHFQKLPSLCLLGPGPKIYTPREKNALVIDKSRCYCTNLFCFKSMSCMDMISTSEAVSAFKTII